MEERNAHIEKTTLGREDHGIMTFMLHLNYGDCGQGCGGVALDEYDSALKRRVGTIHGMQTIMDVLRVTGASSWEKLPGTSVRVRTAQGTILMLGHYLDDKWLKIHY